MLVTREIKLNCRGKETVFHANVPVKLAKMFDMVSEVHAERRERLERLGGQVAEGFAFEVEWRKQAAHQATVFVQDELSVLKEMLLNTITDVQSSEIPPNDVY